MYHLRGLFVVEERDQIIRQLRAENTRLHTEVTKANAALEGAVDGFQSFMDDDSDYFAKQRYAHRAGCNADDTTDSRGNALRPKVNDAGEPYWM